MINPLIQSFIVSIDKNQCKCLDYNDSYCATEVSVIVTKPYPSLGATVSSLVLLYNNTINIINIHSLIYIDTTHLISNFLDLFLCSTTITMHITTSSTTEIITIKIDTITAVKTALELPPSVLLSSVGDTVAKRPNNY